MRSSARLTERRGGFSLLEVIVAASIFSIVLIVAVLQIKETGDAAKLSTVQADLRKQGEKCLNDIVRDLHGALAPYSGAGLATGTGSASPVTELQFCKIAGYNPTTKLPTVFTNLSGSTFIDAPGVNTGSSPPTGNAIADNTTFIFGYSQPSAGANKNSLVYSYGSRTAWLAGTQTQVVLSSELADVNDNQPNVGAVNGFTVSWSTGQSNLKLLSAAAQSPFLDQPVSLTIRLVLKRRINGKVAVGVTDQYAWTTVQTIVMLRPDENY